MLRALRLLVALALAVAAPAAPYGVSTAYVGTLTATHGTWTGLAGAQADADGDAAAVLTEADAAGVAATVQPANGDFATSATGWTTTGGTCSELGCSADMAYDGTGGDPAGSASVQLTSGALTTASVTGTWVSDGFAWASGTPAAVSFAIDRRADVSAATSASWSVVLADATDGDTFTLISGALPADAGFVTVPGDALAAGAIEDGHTYRLEITTSLATSLGRTVQVNYDDVRLTVTPQNLRGTGELRVTGVTPGATLTLEARARTDGESFSLEVPDGTTWNPRLAVTGTTFTTLSYGLLAGEVRDGEVRVRAVDDGQGADDVVSQLLFDHLRVVSTGGITVTAPSLVSLPALEIDGRGATSSTGSVGTVEVVDTGGLASGWTLSATATRWELVTDAAVLLPADAAALTPGAVTTPDASSMEGVSAGSAGALGATPLTLLEATSGAGIGTFRLSPSLTLRPPRARWGDVPIRRHLHRLLALAAVLVAASAPARAVGGVPVGIEVQNVGAPAVTVVEPADGALVTAGAPVAVGAQSLRADWTRIMIDGALIATGGDTVQAVWTPAPGPHVVVAVAGADGAPDALSAVGVTAAPPAPPPPSPAPSPSPASPAPAKPRAPVAKCATRAAKRTPACRCRTRVAKRTRACRCRTRASARNRACRRRSASTSWVARGLAVTAAPALPARHPLRMLLSS